MKKRPLLLVALVIVSAAIVQAAVTTLSPPSPYRTGTSPGGGASEDGKVCTVCGPIGLDEPLPKSGGDVEDSRSEEALASDGTEE